MGRKSKLIYDHLEEPPSGRLHSCMACGKTEVWGPTWAWYGSYKQQDEGLPVYKACSDACMARREDVERERAGQLKRAEIETALRHAEATAARLRERLSELPPAITQT